MHTTLDRFSIKVLECLQSGNIDLKPACHKEVFRIEKQEAYDNSVDYALLNMCAGPIETFCSHVDKENVFECLRVSLLARVS